MKKLYVILCSMLLVFRVVGIATSSNAELTWTKYEGNPVLDVGAPGEWDDTVVFPGSVIIDNSTYKMWYSGGDDGLAQGDRTIAGIGVGGAVHRDARAIHGDGGAVHRDSDGGGSGGGNGGDGRSGCSLLTPAIAARQWQQEH